MGTSITVAGTPYSYEAEAEGGTWLSGEHAGELWWGTRVRYRPGLTGRWKSATLVGTHPLDTPAIEEALRQIIGQRPAA